MKKTALNFVFSALLLAGCAAASAAHLELSTWDVPYGGYSGLIDASNFSSDASDLSGGGNLLVSGADFYAGHGYSLLGGFDVASQGLSLSVTQFLDSTSSGTGNVVLSMPAASLLIAADGEALGTQVWVSFSGTAEAFNQFPALSGMLEMDMAVTSGNTTLGSYLWDASNETSASQPVSFSFLARVGDQISLSGFMISSLSGEGSSSLQASGELNGSFSITAVPEPAPQVLLLTGLAVLGCAVRSSKKSRGC